MRFQCTNCYSVVSIDDSEAGQAVACGQCGSVIVVPRHSTAAGSVIGDFVIEKEIAKGGLATVYLAHQISLDRPAALKILHAQHASNPDYIANFISEARAAAQLNHPNIVQAYAVGEDGGHHYFAMEFVQGTTLKSLLAHSGRLVVERALMIAAEICKALDFAWSNKQLVHRDIKPDNIIVMENGQVKLADLGLAKLGKDFLKKDESEVFGTPQYISPELLLGKNADNRSDIYSLGATLYHAITGKYPYTGNTAAELARKHVTDRLSPPKSIVSDIPEEISGLVEVMMAKRPGHRYQSAAEVMQDIEHFHAGTKLLRQAEEQFQNPINLNRVDAELAATYTPESQPASAGAGSQKAGAQKKQYGKPGKSGSSAAGSKFKASRVKKLQGKSRNLQTGPKGSKLQAAAEAGKKGQSTSAKTGAIPNGAPQATDAADRTGRKSGENAQDTGRSKRKKMKVSAATQSRAKGRAKTPAKSKSGTGFLKGVMAAIVLVAVAAVIVALVIARRDEAPPDKYSEPQQKALNSLTASIRQGVYYETILENAKTLLNKYTDDDQYKTEIRQLVKPQMEEQIRRQRRQLHEAEMTTWLKESRRIQQEREAAAEKARREAMLQSKQEEQEKAQKEREQERQRYIAEMRQRQNELRRQSIKLCRQHEFDEADLLFTEMLVPRMEQFREWGKLKRETIDLAQEAYGLVRNSGELLKGVPLQIPGHARPAKINSISLRKIDAAFREKIYERGKFVREKIEPITLPLDSVPGPVMVKLIEQAWVKKNAGGDAQQLDLLIGAYLLSTGRNLERAATHILRAKRSSLTEQMRAELEEIQKVLAASRPG